MPPRWPGAPGPTCQAHPRGAAEVVVCRVPAATRPEEAVVYQRVSANGDEEVDHYGHTETLDEVQWNY